MKRLLALLVICTMLMTMLASCDLIDRFKELIGQGGDDTCTEHVDENGDYICDKCEAELEKPEPPVCKEHKDEDGDYMCDSCGYVMFEEVSYSFNVGDVDAGTRAEDDINGKFTIVAGTEVRNRTKSYEGVEYTKSVKMGSGAIKVSVPGTGKLRFIVQNGSSGAAVQYVNITSPDGTPQNIEIPGTDEGSPLCLVEIDVTEGDWYIQRVSGTIDVYYLELECVVATASESGFALVSTGKVDFLVGEKLDTSKLQLNATFENGKTDALSLDDVKIDTSKVDMSKEGVYEIVVTYKDYDPIKYGVRVYAPSEIELAYDAIEKLAQNSSAGNGVYFNHSFRELYLVGESLDTKGLSVIVVAKCGDKSMKFRVDEYTIEGFDSSEWGEKTLTISAFGVSTTTSVYVTDTLPTPDDNGVVNVLVDPNYLGPRGGISGVYYVFSTIQQALDFLAKADAATVKELNICPGYYNEKLEITIPNLKITGVGATPEDVVIEWDSLYGLVDAGGFTHTTDSTATVAVREQAINCVIDGVTISNYWNTQERLDEAGLAIERNLALLVQADRFIMKNSRLLAIQDTLELFTGRQYFENVFISGYTDFIFGTNNTTYFKNCTIHTIDTGKDDTGTAGYLTAFKGSNKGAEDAIVYGAIFDGCKFTADEGVGGTEEKPAKTAIGRTWGAYAAVAVINSEIGGHISLDGYDKSENKNKRYISMNGIHPTDETVQFVEYNNTGAGALTEAVAGMRMLTAEEAAKYADFSVIFGKNNGKVSYLDPWDPMSDEVAVDDRDYYYFNGGSSATGTSHTFDTTTTIGKGQTLTWDGLLISAENGNVAWNSNANSLNMKAGAFIKFTVKAGTTVTVETYPNYNYFTLNGVGTASANMLSQYYAEDTEVILLSTGDLYIYSIIIDPNSEAPDSPELESIKASGMTVNYDLGTEISIEGLVVKAIYSDNSVIEIKDYAIDTSAVNINAEGEYEIVISYEGKTAVIKVTYEDPNAGPEISKDTVLDFTTPDALAAVQSNPKVTMTGSIRHNGGEIQITGTISFQVKAGTVITVIPYHDSNYVSYKVYQEGKPNDFIYNESQSIMIFEDCTVIYEGLDNNYLCRISIECPLGEGRYVFGGSTVEGDVTGILESIPGMSVTGTCKTHSGGAQLSSDSQIIFIAPALSTVTIQGFDKSYGQLLVLADGVPFEMDANAQYVINVTYPTTIIIEAVNVGTEEEPAWNKSYITYIDVALPTIVEEDLTINFGSAGNYKDCGIDLSGIKIGDNGGNNSQVKEGSFSFAVRNGAIVTVHGYPGHTSYNLGDGELVYEGITNEYFTYEAWSDCVITISHTTGNNYFYSVDIKYPVEVKPENASLTFGKTGSYHESVPAAIDISNIKIGDNGDNNSQVKEGSITITLFAGAKLTINGFSGYTDYKLSDGTTEYVVNKDSADHTAHVYTAETDVTVTITPQSGNNYFYSIEITY